MTPRIPNLWLDRLSAAHQHTPVDVKVALTRISRAGNVPLRQALILYALHLSQHKRVDVRLIERATGVNAPAIYFASDGLAIKGLVSVDKGGSGTFVELTDKGRELCAGVLQ